jgi:hypothetical protein
MGDGGMEWWRNGVMEEWRNGEMIDAKIKERRNVCPTLKNEKTGRIGRAGWNIRKKILD